MRRNPFVTLLLVVGGIVLLLPGLCSILFALSLLPELQRLDLASIGLVLALLAVCLLISFGGIVLLRQTFR